MPKKWCHLGGGSGTYEIFGSTKNENIDVSYNYKLLTGTF